MSVAYYQTVKERTIERNLIEGRFHFEKGFSSQV